MNVLNYNFFHHFVLPSWTKYRVMMNFAKLVSEPFNDLSSLLVESNQLNCRTNQQILFNTRGSLVVYR